MTTLGEMRSALRVMLSDTAAEGYLWSDAALNLHLNDAIRSYSRSFPMQRETTITTVAGQREYGLPAEGGTVIRVEAVGANGHSPLQIGEGEAPAGVDSYEVYSWKLILIPTPSVGGEPIAVRYLAAHACLAADADLSTVPEADEDLLLAFACARALQGLSTEEAKRQRFENRAGQRAEVAGALYWQQYEKGIRERGREVRSTRLIAV